MYMASVLFLGKYLTASFFFKANMKKKVKSNEIFFERIWNCILLKTESPSDIQPQNVRIHVYLITQTKLF